MRAIAIASLLTLGALAARPVIPFSADLPCGACVRSENVFCQTPKGLPYTSTCIKKASGDGADRARMLEEALNAFGRGEICATDDDAFNKTASQYFDDDTTMLLDFCS